jgi:hypothetical protein
METEKKNFNDEVKRLIDQEPLQNTNYYCIELYATDDGKLMFGCQTGWVKEFEPNSLKSVRKACFVYPEKMRKLLKDLKKIPLIINDKNDYFIFLLFGGFGIVTQNIAETYFSHFIEPKETLLTYKNGYVNIDSIPNKKLEHIPSKTVRMNVLKRDNFRCLSCGESP